MQGVLSYEQVKQIAGCYSLDVFNSPSPFHAGSWAQVSQDSLECQFKIIFSCYEIENLDSFSHLFWFFRQAFTLAEGRMEVFFYPRVAPDLKYPCLGLIMSGKQRQTGSRFPCEMNERQLAQQARPVILVLERLRQGDGSLGNREFQNSLNC